MKTSSGMQAEDLLAVEKKAGQMNLFGSGLNNKNMNAIDSEASGDTYLVTAMEGSFGTENNAESFNTSEDAENNNNDQTDLKEKLTEERHVVFCDNDRSELMLEEAKRKSIIKKVFGLNRRKNKSRSNSTGENEQTCEALVSTEEDVETKDACKPGHSEDEDVSEKTITLTELEKQREFVQKNLNIAIEKVKAEIKEREAKEQEKESEDTATTTTEISHNDNEVEDADLSLLTDQSEIANTSQSLSESEVMPSPEKKRLSLKRLFSKGKKSKGEESTTDVNYIDLVNADGSCTTDLENKDDSKDEENNNKVLTTIEKKKSKRSWLRRHKAKEVEEKSSQIDEPRLLKELQVTQSDLSPEQAYKEKAKLLSEMEKQRDFMQQNFSLEIERLKSEIRDSKVELHICSSSKDVLEVTASEAARELEEIKETVCQLKSNNDSLRCCTHDQKCFIAQLKKEISEKEDQCRFLKKMLLDSQKRAARTICGFLRQDSNPLLPGLGGSPLKESTSEEIKNLRHMALEKNRFAEQVELLSSYNISLEMHVDTLQKQSNDLVKIVQLYEAIGIHLKMDDVRFHELSCETQKLLAFYWTHNGSKELIGRNNSATEEDELDQMSTVWDESLERLQNAAASKIASYGPRSVDVNENCLFEPMGDNEEQLTPKKHLLLPNSDDSEVYSESPRSQRPLSRQRGQREIRQLFQDGDNVTDITSNATNNNACDHWAHCNDFCHEDFLPETDCLITEVISTDSGDSVLYYTDKNSMENLF